MQTKDKIIWIILAGGQAKRMAGKDKGLVHFKNKPLIEHVQEKLLSQGAKLAINANRNLNQYQRYARVFSDLNSDFLGPLAGMQAAMHHLDADWYGFVPCDTPNLPNNLLEKMHAAIEPDTEALVAYDGEHIQPTICMIKSSLLPKLNDFLAQGERKLGLFLSKCNAKKVNFSQHTNAFVNLNTQAELIEFEIKKTKTRT